MAKSGRKTGVLVFLVVVVGLVIISLVAGAIGNGFLKGQSPLSFLATARPEPRLPAEGIFSIFGFMVTNTILATWLTMAIIILVAILATRRSALVPRGIQNIFETFIEMLLGFVESVAGPKNGRRFFPVIATIFLFVILNAYVSLIPGFGSILVKHGEEGAELLRGANTDINTPLALAIVSFAFVEYWGMSSLGFFHYVSRFFNFKRLLKGNLMGLVDVFVGILEFFSELIRLLSFTFRLFGNMTAGEILLLVIVFLVPWGVPVLFYGLELLVGFVQALIFGGLTLVFATMAVAHEAEGEQH